MVAHIPIGDEFILSKKIYAVSLSRWKNLDKLCITYNSGGGSGVTSCTLGPGYTPASCVTLTTENSDIRSDHVAEAVQDLAGDLWFRYHTFADKGVSRLKPDDTWQHFDHKNSELASSAVSMIVVENKNEGLPGDNIWFVAETGITSYESVDGKDVWKLYGEKTSAKDTIARFIGVDTWFKHKINNVHSLEIAGPVIYAANHNNIIEISAAGTTFIDLDGLGGPERKKIGKMFYRKGTILAIVMSEKRQAESVEVIMAYDLKNKKWQEVPYRNKGEEKATTVFFTPISDSNDLATFSFRYSNARFVLYDYAHGSLSGIQVE